MAFLGGYERLTSSAAATAAKRVLRRGAPVTAAKFQRAIHAARRSWREPSSPKFSDAELFWNPPPRRSRDWPVEAGEITNEFFSRLSDDDVAAMIERLEPARTHE